jgi:RNA polymerase sigma-70 factor (ECF subfamily)
MIRAMRRPVTHLLHGRGAERQLVEGLIRGEEACYRQLYEVFSPRLRALLLRIFRDPHLVDDALQTTFLQVFRYIAQFNGQSSLMTWMTQIALNEAGRMARRQTRTRQVAAQDLPEAADPRTPEHQNAEREEYACLAEAIAALPLEKRTALLLFEVEGFSVQEIADVTGEPRGTVLARLSRTRAELRQVVMAQRGPEPVSKPQVLSPGGKRHG